jgi:MazG family protein
MSANFDELVAILDRLREPGGCPWDIDQTWESYESCLNEELEEVIAAMRNRDAENLKEEIGDMLFNLLFVARMAKEEGWFTIEDSIRDVKEKIIRRHPHVFGDAKADTPEEVLEQWAKIKEQEKGS